MRLQTFLCEKRYENKRTKVISEDEFNNIITSKCKRSLALYQDTDQCLYRGDFGSSDSYELGDANTSEPRMSSNTYNYYTLWLDNHPSWKKFPKRSKSFVCSTDEGYADGFGRGTMMVFPFDGADIGICPNYDLWDSFDGFPYGLDSLSSFIHELLRTYFGTNPSDIYQTEYKHLMSLFIQMEKENFDFNSVRFKDGRFKSLMIKEGIIKALEESLNPVRNGFSVIKTGSLLPNKRECWFEGKAVFIPVELKQKLRGL